MKTKINLRELSMSQLLFAYAEARTSQECQDIVAEADRRGRELASFEFLSNGKDEVFQLFADVRENFDGSEYQQGKKDGLRSALALLGHVGMDQFNRGGSQARERRDPPRKKINKKRSR